MKKILITIACMLPMLVIGQTQTENYIKTTAYQVAVNEGQEDNLEPSQKIENVSYVDGLGRSKQTIAVRAGGAKQNIVSYIEYDDLGRTPKQFLPYATTAEVVNPLELVDPQTVKTNIEIFYNTVKYDSTFNPYSEVVYEPSPLSRVIVQAAPGNSWALVNNHTIKMKYQSNMVNEVRYFDIAFTGGNTITPAITLSGYYNSEVLYKTVTKDENWTMSSGTNHTLEEFTNKQGQVLLKRTYNNAQAHDTYYVYDDFGNLTFVLSPEGSEQIVDVNGNLVANYQDILDRLCYQYRYDYRNRLIEKKIPAKGWEYIFYDKLDRPVLTQDARLRENNQYLFTKYDALNRVLYTGIHQATGGGSTSTVRATISTQSVFNETRTLSPIAIVNDTTYYSNGVFPTSNITLHTVNYYDSYIDHAGIILPITVYTDSLTNSTQGLSTVSKVRVLENNDWITSVTGYDEKARPVYGVSVNPYLNTEDIAESRLDFTGKILESKSTHQKTGHQAIVTTDYFTYDHQNRLVTHTQQIDNEPVQLIANNSYDELGQLEFKRVGGELFESGYTAVSPNISITGNIIEKTGGSNAYNAGLSTAGKLEGDGGISFQVLTDNKHFAVGFNNINTSDSYTDLDYMFAFNQTNSRYIILIRESGSNNYIGGYHDYEINDSFAIERKGQVLYFIHNGDTIITHTMTQSYTFLVGDLSIRDVGAKINNFSFYTTSIDKSLQKVDYQYNIRGWLTDINPIDIQGRETDLFQFKINYDAPIIGNASNNGLIKQLYNGNISQTIWKTSNTDTEKRAYAYAYDNLNRLILAYNKKGNTLDTEASNNVGNISYDKNGNILSLVRRGKAPDSETYPLWDDLSYSYNGNQLTSVDDSTNNGSGFYDGNTLATLDDYKYDVNGNMVKDRNKGIIGIAYNHLNLPTAVKISTTDAQGDIQDGTITYIYDATGIKIAKVIQDEIQQSTISTYYAGGYIYEDNNGYEALKLFPHPEGYVEPVVLNGVAEYQYAFNYTDHLGNIRLTYSDSNRDGVIDNTSEIISEKHYYPFGLQQKGYNDVVTSNSNSMAEKFAFNGIEQEQALGLNLYEMGLRQYDPAIARWTSIDPIVHYSMSTYTAFDNNPVFWADPSGANAVVSDNGDNMLFTGEDAVAAFNIIAENNFESSESSSGCDDCSKCPKTCGQNKSSAFSNMTPINGMAGIGMRFAMLPDSQEKRDVMAAAGTEIILFVAGEWAFVKIFQGGRWVYRMVQAKRLSKGIKFSDDLIRLAESNITNSGTTVLGHFDSTTGGYISKARELGASYFDIGDVWSTLTNAERWGLNQHFLNQVIQKGDNILLSVSRRDVKPSSYLAKEINYLLENGYKWIDNFTLKK